MLRRYVISTISLLIASGQGLASPIIVDANGRTVGFYQGLGVNGLEVGVTLTGYRFGFERKTGKLAPTPDLGTNFWSVFFSEPNCSGQAYVEAANRVGGFVAIPDFEFQATADPPVYYVPQDVPPIVSIQRRSTLNYEGSPPLTLGCYNDGTPSTVDAIPVQPNSPGETGIQSPRFQPPLRAISSWLFRDGFEQPLSRAGLHNWLVSGFA